jgi:hypothetical protein
MNQGKCGSNMSTNMSGHTPLLALPYTGRQSNLVHCMDGRQQSIGGHPGLAAVSFTDMANSQKDDRCRYCEEALIGTPAPGRQDRALGREVA